MRTTKLLIATLTLTLAAVAHADPKCSHRNGGGLFANTNPQKAVVTKPTTNSNGQTVKGSR
ncbi:MAG: hypothetical protein ACLGGX_00445 [Bdellovibrionia bacterium]